MGLGIAAAIIACATWAMAFPAPYLVLPYQPVDLTLVRYGVFGLVSLAVMLAVPRLWPRGVTAGDALDAGLLGLMGYVLFSLASSYAVLLAGIPAAVLVIGLLPIALAVVGNRGAEKVAWRRLALPLSLIGVGLVVVNTEKLGSGDRPVGEMLLGLALAFICLGLWTLYALWNKASMARRSHIGPVTWTCLQGAGTLAGLPVLALAGLGSGLSAFPTLGAGDAAFGALLFWAVATGIGASWVPSVAWSVTTRRLPLALSAQLLSAETVFGLLYAFILEARGPTAAEAAGTALILAGVAVAVRVFTAPVRMSAVTT